MDLHETYLAHRDAIAAGVRKAEQVPLIATEMLSVPATAEFRDNGNLTVRQGRSSITLTPSQAIDLMNRIAVAVLRAQTEGMS